MRAWARARRSLTAGGMFKDSPSDELASDEDTGDEEDDDCFGSRVDEPESELESNPRRAPGINPGMSVLGMDRGAEVDDGGPSIVVLPYAPPAADVDDSA